MSPPREVDAIAGTIGDAKLAHPVANGLGIAWVSQLQRPDADQDARAGAGVPQVGEPGCKCRGLANVDHL